MKGGWVLDRQVYEQRNLEGRLTQRLTVSISVQRVATGEIAAATAQQHQEALTTARSSNCVLETVSLMDAVIETTMGCAYAYLFPSPSTGALCVLGVVTLYGDLMDFYQCFGFFT